jgi:phospholipase/carboxylesterase
LQAAILLRAMATLSEAPPADLTANPVLIVSGALQPIVPAESAARLASRLDQRGAAVEHRTLPAGHELSQADVALARTWLESNARAGVV